MDNSFHYLVMATHGAIQKQLMARLKETGLTIGQPKVLDYLHDHDGANQTEIARACHIEAATLTTLLNRMEEKALLERRVLNGNRRTYYIYLTERGAGLARQIREIFAALEEEAFSGVPEDKRQMLTELLSLTYRNLTERNR